MKKTKQTKSNAKTKHTNSARPNKDGPLLFDELTIHTLRMKALVRTILNAGFGGVIIETECSLSNGLPGIIIVGLGGKAVSEAKERIRSALANHQIKLPRKRIIINLAPADIPKDSTSLDIAITAAILIAGKQVTQEIGADTAVIGELGLDGTIRPVRGIIGKLLAGKSQGIQKFFIPLGNLQQALLVPGLTILPLRHVGELYLALNQQLHPRPQPNKLDPAHRFDSHRLQLADVVGQTRAKRALQIAAAGGHNVLLSGPPGTGKSMLAKAMISILPPLSRDEMLEVTHIHSLADARYEELITSRPFRAPHHSASQVAIVGGGHSLRPGEISLSHHGVLFFDEFPEFARTTIEALRQPLEDHQITISRAKESATYPAKFIFIATANPCPCGYYGTKQGCDCTLAAIRRYRQKMSGPILDRIDLYVIVDEVDHRKLLARPDIGSDELMRNGILIARKAQATRYATSNKLNAHTTNKELKALDAITKDALDLLNKAATTLHLSARSYMRVLKVARTIADLECSAHIKTSHLSEALQYRDQNAL